MASVMAVATLKLRDRRWVTSRRRNRRHDHPVIVGSLAGRRGARCIQMID